MLGLNKIYLMGRLGKDPEIHRTKEGRSFCVLSLATERRIFNSADKKGSTLTDWHRVLVWGKQAELCQDFLSKGSPVLMEGHMTTYTATPKSDDEKPVRKTAIHADQVTFLPHQPAHPWTPKSDILQRTLQENLQERIDLSAPPEPYLSTESEEFIDEENLQAVEATSLQ